MKRRYYFLILVELPSPNPKKRVWTDIHPPAPTKKPPSYMFDLADKERKENNWLTSLWKFRYLTYCSYMVRMSIAKVLISERIQIEIMNTLPSSEPPLWVHKYNFQATKTAQQSQRLVRHYTCLSKKSRHSGFSPLKKRPEFEFTVRDSLCLCLIIHS